jgi:DNA replication protein DnaC
LQQKNSNKVDCPKCRDSGWIVTEGDNGGERFERCDCVANNAAAKLFGGATLSDTAKSKTFMGFVVGNQPQEVKAAKMAALDYVDRFDEIKNTKRGSIAFLGQSGAGKTHLSFAIANALKGKGVSGICYFQHVESFFELRGLAANDPAELDYRIRKTREVPVLIWDDLFKGRERPTDWTLEVTMNIINYRYLNRLPTIISSERTRDSLIDIDTAIGCRIYEMCKDYLIEFVGEKFNFRTRR